jgi:DNA modification methylase
MADIQLLHGNCLDILPTLPDCSVDSIVTDPPYELGFMGKKWDNSGIAYNPDLWAECLRVLKPGGHLLAFGGTRTYHRMAVAIEDAGFEIRDSLHWIYGSGFPKSLDVSKAIDKMDAGVEQQARRYRFTAWVRSTGITSKQIDEATGTNMGGHYTTSASQPAIMTREHLEACRHLIHDIPEWVEKECDIRSVESKNFAEREVIGSKKTGDPVAWYAQAERGDGIVDITAPATEQAKEWQGWGTALKPAHEPIVVARKPLVGTVAGNVLQWGTGALNIDGTRVGNEERTNNFNDFSNQHGNQFGNGAPIAKLGESKVSGRWPANIVFTHNHDCGDICTEGCPVRELNRQSGISKDGVAVRRNVRGQETSGFIGRQPDSNDQTYGGSGGASRFFTVTEWDAPFRYVAKPGKRERNAGLDALPLKQGGGMQGTADKTLKTGSGNERDGRNQNHHPTVKPLALMRWLVRLVTPPNGTVLETFAGSGTTLVACHLEGFNAIGIEMTDEYLPIIEGRLEWARQQPTEQDNPQQELEL